MGLKPTLMGYTRSRILKGLSELRAMTWRERALLTEASALLPLARLAGDTIARYGVTRRPAAGIADAQAEQLARRTARLVALAGAGLPFHCSCLQRSAVLHLLLRQQGIQADLRLGVRRNDGSFEAHAWVEVAGQPINDAPDIAEDFLPF